MRQATEPRRPFMLPFHHPAELAHRICMPDHISQGRLMVGIGASGANLELEMLDRCRRARCQRLTNRRGIA
ncbi:LLM class flavin-dependent oxidoreductase [Burkholderia ubonensis]|uniref:LLM class flavin-dependent oxidoreductase n=1 Tax=Burkholderia ubonensis TaxID=101571 RepID=UPI0009B32C92|nr:LLM class flavin-dependent oxidoreductase [Burkholderia ubonensis]